jgi:RNA polymerase sigma-70 factor (ECF subfamily)
MRLRRSRRELPVDPREEAGGPGDVEESLDRFALRDWTWTALERLPDDQRVTVMLRYFGRHSSYEELAATLGVPIGTVRSRLSQAKARLVDELLRTAAAAHLDHDRLLAERRREWDQIAHEIYSTGRATLYACNCAADVVVEAPSIGYREIGAEDHRRGVLDSAEAGVRLELTNVIASEGVTIWEGDYQNPSHDPDHCPATHTELRIHPSGQTTRLVIYFPR